MKFQIKHVTFAIDIVAFDKDGTLVGNVETWRYIFDCYMQTAMGMGLDIQHEAKRLFGYQEALPYSPLVIYYANEGITLLAAAIWLTYGKPWSECRLLSETIIQTSNQILDETKVYKPNPGAIEAIHLFSQHVPVCIASSDNQHNIQKMIDIFHIREQISMVVTSNEVKHGKPSPDILHHITNKFGKKPESLLYIGDNLVDVQTAKNANAKCIIVGQELKEADLSIHNLQELVNGITMIE